MLKAVLIVYMVQYTSMIINFWAIFLVLIFGIVSFSILFIEGKAIELSVVTAILDQF